MDLQYYGGNCLSFSYKGTRIVVDDNLAELGAKSIIKLEDVALYTGPHGATTAKPRLLLDGPGEYEVGGFSIIGITARANMDAPETHNATIYKLLIDDVSYLVTGHIYPDLNDNQLEAIGTVDVMIVPVGGNGYTVDPTGALQLIKKIEPKLIVPTHYAEVALQYPVEQRSLEDALKTMAMEPKETTAKLRYKAGEASDMTQLVVITRS